jgi:hypothetical protein
MYNHSITQALAGARVADLQRAATHSTATVPARRHRRHLRALAVLGLAATAALASTSALAQPTHDAATAQIHTIAEPSQPATSRSFDIEANKAASMRALSRHLAEQAEDRALAQERYYESFGKHATTDNNVTPAADRALAQERYYASYGKPSPPTMATRTVAADTGDGIAPLPFVVALFGALIVGLSAGSGLHLLHARRRYRTRSAT